MRRRRNGSAAAAAAAAAGRFCDSVPSSCAARACTLAPARAVLALRDTPVAACHHEGLPCGRIGIA